MFGGQAVKTARPKPLLTVTCGMPGSGKSTWAVRQVAQERLVYVVSADAIREHGASGSVVFDGMELSARRALRNGLDVIVDACALDPRTRNGWLRLAHELGASSRLVVFATPLAVCRERDAARPLEQRARIDWADAERKVERVFERVGLELWDRVTVISHVSDTGARV